MEENSKWKIYILRCMDNSLYTGITIDIDRRYKEHKEGRGAKYTRSRKVKSLEVVFEASTKSEAGKLEYRIKKLPKLKKEELIKKPGIMEDLKILWFQGEKEN